MKSRKEDDWDPEERDALQDVREDLDALRARHAADPPVDLLRAAQGLALPDELQAAADRHLAESAWSRTVVEGMADADAGLSRGDEERLLARIRKTADASQPRQSGRSRYWWPAMAGAAAAGLVATVWITTRESGPQPTPAQPEATVAVAPPAPAFELPLDKPEIKLSVAALTWRGASTENPFLSDLKPAIDAFRGSDYEAADRAFSTLATKYPDSPDVLFYHGVTRLFLKDAPGAIQMLARAERAADRTFAVDIVWYRAVAEQRAGNPAAARERLAGLCAQPGERSAAACDALKKIEAPSKSPR
jgi:TolA-binding protein